MIKKWLRNWLLGSAAYEPVAQEATPRQINAMALLAAGPGGQPVDRTVTFSMPSRPPGVRVPTGMAMDDCSALTNMNSWASSFEWHGPFDEGIGFFGYQYLAQLWQRSEYRIPCERLAKEMTRKWIRVTAKGDKTAKVEAMNAALERFNVRQIFRKVIEQDSGFGRGHIFIDVGVEGPSLARPMLPQAQLGKGKLKGFRVVEAMWAYPLDYDTSNPLREDFYVPQKWVVMSDQVHRTRLLTVISRPMPDLLKPAYQFGGMPLTQLAKPYVQNWLETRQSVNDLVQAFSQMVLKTNMGTVLDGGSGADLWDRVDLFNRTRNNRGTMVIQKDEEELDNIAVPLTTLDMLQAQAQEHMAAPFQMPLIILFGITPTGLNATAEPELVTFETWVHAQQEDVIRPPLQTVFEAIQYNEFGEIDPDLGFEFVELREESAKDAADRRKVEADTDVALVGAGILHPTESRERLATDAKSVYTNIDLSDEPPEPADPADEGDPLDEEA